MRTPAGSVILWATSAGTTLPRNMLEVSQSFYALLQKNVLNTPRWQTREDLSLAIVVWIENRYNRRRQRRVGRLTPVEFEGSSYLRWGEADAPTVLVGLM